MASSNTLRIAVIGVGIAGRVRIRDFVNEIPLGDSQLPGVTLAGYVSRRQLDIEGVEQLSLENVMDDKTINTLLICTENERHEILARQGLVAGKNVLVEFPLALTHGSAKELFQLAHDKNVTCYEEDISLLTDSHKTIKDLVKQKGLKTIEKTLKGRPNGWIEDIDRSGSPFVSGISMIHRVLDLTGGAVAKDAYIIRKAPDSYIAVAKLEAQGSIPVTLNYERGPHIERRASTFSYTLADGSVIDDKTLPSMVPKQDTSNRSGLFLRDMVKFMKTVMRQSCGSEGEKLTLESLKLADDLYRLAKLSPQSSGL